MKQLLNEMKSAFSERGYRKAGNSFWKVENGFYKLVNFQKGAYGDYFFVNVHRLFLHNSCLRNFNR